MRPIVIDRVAWSVGLSVTLVSPAKTVAQIEMPFGLRTRVGPRNHALHGVQIPMGRGNFEEEKRRPIVKYRHTTVICAKTAEPIEMPFGFWARNGPRNHLLDSGSGQYVHKLECGPMPNVMVALPNIGGALCSTPQSLADAHYYTVSQKRVPP